MLYPPTWPDGEPGPEPGEFKSDEKGNLFYAACYGELIGQAVAKMMDMRGLQEKSEDDVLTDLIECNDPKYHRTSLNKPDKELLEGTLPAEPPSSWEVEDDDEFSSEDE